MKKHILIGLLICSIYCSCNKNSSNSNNSATNGYVDVTINIINYNSLNVVGGWIYYPTGTRNIIVYRKSISEFMAYDRACTYQTDKSCAPLIVDVSSTFAVDSCKNCGSKFLLIDGSVNKSPATIPLTRYQTSYDGANMIHVFN
ncbi:MAG: hypothetical protein IT235_06965 [Bacteroidia bacterium]|nr:hypothetical protein [Bacteroidia bacterium]